MHCSKRMFKSRMLCTWIDKMCTRKLPYFTQSLKHSRINDIKFMSVYSDKIMNRIDNLKIFFYHFISPDILKQCVLLTDEPGLYFVMRLQDASQIFWLIFYKYQLSFVQILCPFQTYLV